jgi:hypothetical protein
MQKSDNERRAPGGILPAFNISFQFSIKNEKNDFPSKGIIGKD